jgi:hypothetical protein
MNLKLLHEFETHWRMPMRQCTLWRQALLVHAHAPEGATMRQELFLGACWFIPGNNSCAKIFWHISHMPVTIHFQTLQYLW